MESDKARSLSSNCNQLFKEQFQRGDRRTGCVKLSPICCGGQQDVSGIPLLEKVAFIAPRDEPRGTGMEVAPR